MRFGSIFLWTTVFFVFLGTARSPGAEPSKVVFPIVGGEQRDALLCRPAGSGPFPAVVFNHGSVVDMYGWPGARTEGYFLDTVCQAFAQDGYLTFAPIREKRAQGKNATVYREIYGQVVSSALDHVKTLPEVDASRIVLAGFSMGGFTSFKVALERQDLKALVLLAPATVHGLLGSVAKKAGALSAPVLLLTEAHDARHILEGAALLERAFQTHKKEARVIRYDRGGGHELFYNVGYYWEDVRTFLREHLGAPAKN